MKVRNDDQRSSCVLWLYGKVSTVMKMYLPLRRRMNKDVLEAGVWREGKRRGKMGWVRKGKDKEEKGRGKEGKGDER